MTSLDPYEQDIVDAYEQGDLISVATTDELDALRYAALNSAAAAR